MSKHTKFARDGAEILRFIQKQKTKKVPAAVNPVFKVSKAPKAKIKMAKRLS